MPVQLEDAAAEAGSAWVVTMTWGASSWYSSRAGLPVEGIEPPCCFRDDSKVGACSCPECTRAR